MITLFKKVPKETILHKIATTFPNHALVRFHDYHDDPSVIIHAMLGQSLFGESRIIFLSELDRALWDDIIGALSQIGDDTEVYWLEDSFPVAYLKKVPNHTIIEEKGGTSEKSTTNPFVIANTLASGGVHTWAEYRQLIHEGNEPEALFGIMWWKIKDIAKKKPLLSKNFKKTITDFMKTYSVARSGKGDLETGLERLLIALTKDSLV